jgi:RHS repeat-associated protein
MAEIRAERSGDLPVIFMELNTSGNIMKTYIGVYPPSVWRANSQIIAQHDGNHSASKYFYLHDRLGSVRQVINSSGNVVNYYTYEPFGEALESSESVANPFKFTGQYFDSEIGLYYLRNRQYHPKIYRFTSRDLVSGSIVK